MDKKFASGDTPLSDLLGQAQSGALQLPDFQRSWVWNDSHIASLLASVSLSYPIGAVMTLRTGNPDVKFKTRPLEGVDVDPSVSPEFLLLDGQQRITSLYLALRSNRSVKTRDTRGNVVRRRYFANIDNCIDPDFDREEAIISVPEDGKIRNFRGEVVLDVSDRQQQVESRMFPLEIVLNPSETRSWMMGFYSSQHEIQELMELWDAFDQAFIRQFERYRVPSIELARTTPKEAVCQVFEKVNTGGVSLTVFELLTATFAAEEFLLRDDWETRETTFDSIPVLDKFQATEFLQIISLLATWQRRKDFLATDSAERAPAVSCKRKDVLKLPLQDYKAWADKVTDTLSRTVSFLHAESIYTSRDVPYLTQLVPLTAILAALGDRAEHHSVLESLRRWFWCGVFGEMYGGTTETRFANDLQDVLAWIDGGEEPRTVRESQFQANRLISLQSRNSAAYKGFYARQMKRGARDLRSGLIIDANSYQDDAIDFQHIFPQRWCAENDIPRKFTNSIVNKTAVDSKTARRIGRSAPSAYLPKLESGSQLTSEKLDELLRSHDIDPVSLRSDDFEKVFSTRYERLIKQVEEATGKETIRPIDRSDNPFLHAATDPGSAAEGIRRIIDAGESRIVEFKSTGMLNLHTGLKDPAIEWSVVKTIAGFMNSHGGTLLVGVADDGSLVGIERDYSFLKKQDRDGWELWMTDRISSCLGKVAAADLEIEICDLEGVAVARVDVGTSPTPVFATPLKGEKRPTFLVRLNNSTQELTGQDAHDFQRKRWSST